MAIIVKSRAHLILEAVQYTSNGDISSLRQSTANRLNDLKLDILLRILLTYLPTGTEPSLYIDILRDISTARNDELSQPAPNHNLPTNLEISEDEARVRVRRLHLEPLVINLAKYNQDTDPLTLFLLRQAHKIDAETGSLEVVSQLLEPFVDHSDVLRTWMVSYLLPLLRLDYEYYPHSRLSHTLDEFEGLDDRAAVQSLLSKAAQRHDPGDTQSIGRDLRGLVGPWMYGDSTRKRRKVRYGNRRKSSITQALAAETQNSEEDGHNNGGWFEVSKWLLDLSLRDFQRRMDVSAQWDGPKDVDYGEWGKGIKSMDERDLQTATRNFAQAGLASIYGTNECSLETIIGSHRILVQVAKLVGLEEPPNLQRSDTSTESGIPQHYLENLYLHHLRHDRLLSPENRITSPSQSAVDLLNVILSSCYKLLNLGNARTSRSVAELALFGTLVDQKGELLKTLHKLKAGRQGNEHWASVRQQILWLHNWEQYTQTNQHDRGVFRKIPTEDIENEILRAMLDGGCCGLAVEVYCQPERPPLPSEVVESTVLSAVLSSYDAASNGNRTRGGVRKASEILSTFAEYFPKSTGFAQTSALLAATHSMSFYSLILQHGVPFKPVNIRAHKDPMLLIAKILSQNEHSYTHLDDLLEIGQNLVAAGLIQPTNNSIETDSPETRVEQQSLVARRRVTRMAIEAALEEDDFDTAYSYVVNRLSSPDQAETASGRDQQDFPFRQDDISWRAAYQAGRFATGSPVRALRRLEQRTELLSQALLLAPSSALSEVLTAWQKCEEEITVHIAREAEEEEIWDEKGDRKLPGGFTVDAAPIIQKSRDPGRGALLEEAPMGLFDVARGAAAALSKSTFPLRSARQSGMDSPSKAIHDRSLSTGSFGSSDEGSINGAGGRGRVRKRDMVSSMVTGGLASGIGWVIGAPPARQE